ncbi:putative cation transporter [Leptomonas pyrrhocoris]|uniref:Putative cation transporter n=1 Tax=Leptomonas pyrrhocoris TaxID=157538 RepID=A0A0N1J531_LEPPY|nr:putative cation transporter [Leptomonas pyrrhocoris]KPA82918.1 putative cation transporter [Leptomonas pyrrhocoris]|eukprot:XP_015661357.1 putative cation transporter [Leptomonas pyrrhocoris]
MRRFFTMKAPPIASTHDLAAKAMPSAVAATTAATGNQLRGHGHSHGGHGHAHSHGTIEKNISGKFLRQCQIATLAGGAANVFFCVTKLWIGSAGGSVALVADGFHALTDILADIISYGAISLSQKKFSRCRFPFGIGRLETSGAVLVAAILLFGGIALLVQSLEQCVMDVSHLLALAVPTGGIAVAVMLSVRNALAAATSAATASLSGSGEDDSAASHGHSHAGGAGDIESAAAAPDSHGHSHDGDAHHGHSHFEVTQYDASTGKQVILWTMVCIAAASVVTKELLFRWTRRVGKRAGSRVVIANAYHHRADAWSGGVALIGVAGQVVGIPGIDGVAGLAVSLSICKIGYGLFRDAVLEFFDYQNADEVSAIREQLQDFSLRIGHGKRVVPAKAAMKENQADAAKAAQTSLSRSASTSSSVASVATSDDPNAVARKKILFMNVFLVRHGHKYALHVTLLVYESVQATQIREATDLLTALARGSLPVQDTFTTILVCSNHTEPREEYLGSDEHADEEEEGDGDKPDRAAAAAEKAQDHSHSAEKEGDSADELHTAATGNIVNPSLERCIASLEEFHTFSARIRYNWEARTITAPSSASSECDRDIASVAEIFRCRLINNSAACGSGAAGEAECAHGHAHQTHSAQE